MLKRILLSTTIVIALIIGGYYLSPKARSTFQRVLSNIINSPEEEPIAPPAPNEEPVAQPNLPGMLNRPESPRNATYISTADIIDATNMARVAAGIAPLQTNTKLGSSAVIKTQDMITRKYFEHTAPTGEGVAELGTRVGYDYITLGENLALGNFMSAQDLIDAWMNSPGHRANILNPLYQEIGVYAEKGIYQGKSVWFAVQHFGTSREVCPSISSSNKRSIETLKETIADQEETISKLRSELNDAESVHSDEYREILDQFTAEVTEYNTTIARLKERVDRHNAQVTIFNECLSVYQKR